MKKIEWAGEIPEGWENCKLKNICSIYGRIGFRGYTQADLVDEGEGAITLSPSNMRDGKMSYDKCSFLSWDKYYESPEIQIKNGDILFVKTGSTYGKTSIVENLPMDATINPQIVVIKEIKVNKKFLYYYLLTPLIQAQVECAVIGGTIPTIAQSKIMNFTVLVPPLDEQQKIADFLDRECERIDGLKADIEEQIETLEKYKRSVITEAVTHGLNSETSMKDSGVDYIGRIKLNWKVTKVGFVCTKLARGFLEEDPALICSNNGNVVLRDEQHSHGKMVSEDNAMQGIRAGDIAIHGMDTWHGAIGLSTIRGKITRVVHVCDSTEDKRFIVYYLKSLAYQGVYKLISSGVRGNTSDFRSWDKVKDIFICLPEMIEEENEICNYLDKIVGEINELIAQKQLQIETLESYKKSLIFEYVTGKKEVV